MTHVWLKWENRGSKLRKVLVSTGYESPTLIPPVHVPSAFCSAVAAKQEDALPVSCRAVGASRTGGRTVAVPARIRRTVAELVQGERAPALAPDEVAESLHTVESGEFAHCVSPPTQELALGARGRRAAGTGASDREPRGGGVQARLSPRGLASRWPWS